MKYKKRIETKMRLLKLLLCAFSIIGFSSYAQAEYPGLEKVLKPEISAISKLLSGKSVLVAIPDPAEFNRQWRLTSAIETEIIAQLLAAGIKAVDEDTDERFTWLANSNIKSSSRWQKYPVYDILVTGHFSLNKTESVLNLTLSFYIQGNPDSVHKITVDLTPAVATLSANVSSNNASVAKFMEANRGQAIGDGICATAAEEALRHVKCDQFGLYVWGRRLTPNEALLPGDIVQYEYATFRKTNGKQFTLAHHTAIINEIVSGDTFRVLHQNVGAGATKKTVTAGTYDMTKYISGSVVFFRPTKPRNVLPIDPIPYRKAPAEIVMTNRGHVDLLQTVDPELDAVHGIWGKWNGPISSHKDRFLRLQFPFDLPESYTVRAKIKRTWGNDTYGMVLNVGGHQTLLSIDAYAGTRCGLDLVDGKKVSNNSTTRKIKNILPLNKTVSLTVAVSPSSVRADIDGREVVNWSGDPSRLSLQEAWQVPNKSWLHLGAYLSVFETESLTLQIDD